MKKIAASLALSIASLILISDTTFAWTNPSANPTGGAGTIVIQGGAPTNTLYIKSDGNVGIGNTTAGYKLHVTGSSLFDTATGVSPLIVARSYKTSNFEEARMGVTDGVFLVHYIQDESTSSIQFRVQNTDMEAGGGVAANDRTIMTILGDSTSGRVGIGTTGPTTALEVNGTVKATTFEGTSTSTISATNVSSGNFGANTGGGNYTFPASIAVGTTAAPVAKLDVNGTAYLPQIFINRVSGAGRGISWYSPTYTSWTDYVCQAAQTGCGPTANITTPTGSLVTAWGKRSFIENTAGYGWTFESGTSTGQPTVVAEIRSSDGEAKFNGGLTVGGALSVTGNSNTCQLVSYSGGTTACPAGYYTWSGQALASGYMLCCKVSNPI